MARLKDKYFSEIVPALKDEFGYRNVMEVPRVTKVTLNMGVGEAQDEREAAGRRRRGTRPDHRPAAGDHQGAQVDRRFQAARGHVHRLPRHASR